MLYQLKAGIIGLGELGQAYAPLLKNHIKDLSLLGAVGRTQKELLYAKNDLSLEYVYSDDKALIQNHDIDALFIFCEAARRPHIVIQAIEAGKHVFLADPIALNVEDAEAVHKSAASRPSQLVMVSSLVRYNPLLASVRKMIKRGEIGVVNHITLDSSFFNGLNRRHSSSSGSMFLDSALDELDLCLWLLDESIDKVNVKRTNNTITCEAVAKSGASIHFMLHPEMRKEQSFLNIYGNNGQIVLSNTNYRSYKLYRADGVKSDFFLEKHQGFLYSEYIQMHEFTNAVLGRVKAQTRTPHSVDIVKLAVAMEKSMALDRLIELEQVNL